MIFRGGEGGATRATRVGEGENKRGIILRMIVRDRPRESHRNRKRERATEREGETEGERETL